MARDGATVRRFSSVDPGRLMGEPLPIEQDWPHADGAPGRPEDHLTADAEYTDAMWQFLEADDVAAAISMDVGWRRPTVAQPRGAPVLALFPDAGAVHVPPGAYEI